MEWRLEIRIKESCCGVVTVYSMCLSMSYQVCRCGWLNPPTSDTKYRDCVWYSQSTEVDQTFILRIISSHQYHYCIELDYAAWALISVDEKLIKNKLVMLYQMSC